MLFNSFAFVLFAVVVLLSYHLLRAPNQQNVLLLAASLFFYAYGDWKLLSLILLCALDGYVVAILLHRRPERSRPLLVVGIAVPLAVLGTFKYFDFFVDEVGRLTELVGLGSPDLALELALPVGISFYTFQTIGYVVDVHRGLIEPERDPLVFFLFVTFFPQLVAGPIERSTNLLPQIRRRRTVDGQDLLHGTYLIAQGFTKKIVIADNVKPIVDSIFAIEGASGPLILVGSIAFAIQIYGDFSGYTDIARGIARLLGFRLLLNFRRPYWSTNPAEFWNRWHITLSNWFRDYVYIPLGGNRAGRSRTLVNLMATMTLSGLWHGASANFVLWGAFHGTALIVHRVWSDRRPGKAPVVLGWVGTMLVVVIGWYMFRVTDGGQLIDGLSALVLDPAFGGLALATLGTVVPYLALMVAVDIVEWRVIDRADEIDPSWILSPVLTSLVVMIAVLGSDAGGEFIYFAF
ncbi:MAG: MBOAT family O-acyltransferase [Actinomycetota bacterium]